MQEYWYCPECDAVFADAAGTQLTNRKNLTIPALGDIKGDVTGDGKVNAVDYLLLKKYVLGTAILTPEQLNRADVNEDGRINSVDYVLLMRIVLG